MFSFPFRFLYFFFTCSVFISQNVKKKVKHFKTKNSLKYKKNIYISIMTMMIMINIKEILRKTIKQKRRTEIIEQSWVGNDF